jgi:hypothetical protein
MPGSLEPCRQRCSRLVEDRPYAHRCLGADSCYRPSDPAFGATALPLPGKRDRRILPASAVVPDRWHKLRRRETSLRTRGRSLGNPAQPPKRHHCS